MESFNVRPQTHKRLKERVSIGRSRAKSAHFRGSPLFQATHNIKQQQTNKQLIQLILCQLDVGGWRKEKATRLTEAIKKRASIFKKKKFRTLAVNYVSDFLFSFNVSCIPDLDGTTCYI